MTTAVKRQNVEDIYRLSPVQQGMLFHSLLAPESGVYYEQFAFPSREGFDPDLFLEAWRRVIEQRPTLRTSFLWENLDDPVQIVHRRVELPVERLDWRALPAEEQEERFARLLEEDRRRGFDLSRPPLVRLTLVRLDEDAYRIVWGYHHLLLDGWSAGLLMAELAEVGTALTRGAEPRFPERRPFRDYVAWLRKQDLAEAGAYWTRALEGFSEPTPLVVDRPAAGDAGTSGYELTTRELGEEESRSLQELSKRQRVTLNTVAQAAWAALLMRYGAGDDVVFGVTVSGRPPGLRGVERMLGCFINTLPARVRIDRGERVADWLERVQEEQVELRRFEHTPLVEVAARCAVPRDRELFESIVVFESFTAEAAIDTSHSEVFQRTNYPLTMVAAPGDRMLLRAGFETARFDRRTAERLLAHWGRMMVEIARRPDARVGELDPLSPEERRTALLEWNDPSADFRTGICLHELFATRARRQPDATALVAEADGVHRAVTYGELDRRANRLARHLGRAGVGPDTLVGLCCERSVEMVVAILGILKAGGAYVPLDPKAPAERLAFMVEDSGAAVVVTAGGADLELPDLEQPGVELVRLDADRERIEREEPTGAGVPADPRGLAYVIYTSGSTGRPKGSLIPHENVQRLLDATDPWFGFGADDVWTLFHSFAFDFSVWELWGPLAYGGRLVVVPYWISRSPEAFHELLRRERVTVLNQTPSAFKQLAAADAEAPAGDRLALREVVFGGEALEPASLAPWFERHGDREPRLVNMYGITETTVHVTWRPVSAADAAGEAEEAAASPVGVPIPDLTVHLLDPWMNLVPEGVPGEIHVGGAGLARGYLGRAGLTAERFVPDPFAGEAGAPGDGGGRLYKAGDLARRLPGGGLDFLGRIDHQVKVRGFRIELGEIEAVLSRHPAVGQVAVVAREDDPAGGVGGGDRRLVAYVVPDSSLPSPGSPPDAAELREHAARFLPDYMVPAAFVALEALPLTVNGKLDRAALPAPEEAERLGAAAELEPPATPTEELLAGIWADVLGVDAIGRRSDFFDLGGHSLLATRVASRVRQTLGVSIPLRALFEAATLAEAAAQVDGERSEDLAPPMEPISDQARYGGAPLSFAQERLWFLDRMDPESSAYNVPGALRLRGGLDAGALARSLTRMVRRHESLRTLFDLRGGRPVQVVRPAGRLPLPLIDLSALPPQSAERLLGRLGAAEVERPFDLGTGPLVRTNLVRLGEREHALLVTMHHIVSDATSLGVFVDELAALYRAAHRSPGDGLAGVLPALPVQYPDYATWQRRWLSGDVLEAELSYWRERLAGADGVLDLPTDRPRPSVQSYRGDTLSMRLPGATAGDLRRVAREHGATLFMVLMAGFQAFLGRLSGQDDLIVGSTIANRRREEVQGLIGFFVNTLALRADLSDDPSFADLVARVRDTSLGAYDHQDLPFEKLVEEIQPQRDLSRSPLFQVVMQLQNVPAGALELPGLELAPIVADSRTAKFDLILNFTELRDGIHGLWRYKTHLFDRTSVQRMARNLEVFLAGLAADPARALSAAPLLAPGERHQLLVEDPDAPGYPWPPADDPAAAGTVHGLFEERADAAPDAVALWSEEGALTYGALDRRAEALARALRRRGVGPETRVALCLDRSLDLVVAVLGVLKAGGAYVPLDPAYPAERLAFSLEDSGAPVVVTREALLPELPAEAAGTEALCIDREPVRPEAPAGGRLGARVDGGALAYVIYTSGSTGRPKGVPVTHRNAVRLLRSTERWFGFGPHDTWTLFHSYAFDFSVWELWGALAYGGRLTVVPYGVSRSPEDFHRLLGRQRVTVLNQTPSAFRQLVRADAGAGSLEALRLVVFGGEALELESLAPWFSRYGDRQPELVNMYGITETTVHVTYRPVAADDLAAGRGSVIGGPIPDLRIHLLDRAGQPAPIGTAGEIHVGGAGLARGYLARPGLTAERFVPDPFPAAAGSPGARLYRSGDLARRLADGEVEYLGRIDHQVKVRGFRIELGEIESALAAHPDLAEAVVLAKEPAGAESDGPRLVAYAVPRAGSTPAADELRRFLGRSLPEHMVPSAFLFLDAIPLTPNGKVDRKALPEPEAERPDLAQEYVAPRDALEERLAELWREVLEIDRVGVHDDFFDLGGNSLVGAVLINRLQELLGEIVQVVVIFDAPTVAALADHVRDQHPEAVVRLLGETAAGVEAARDETVAPVDPEMVDRVRRTVLGMERFTTARGAERPANPPAVFVLSAPRSGSTLLRVMLGGHPRLFSPPELELLSFDTLADRRRVFSGRDAFWLEGAIRALMELDGGSADEARSTIEGWEREGLSTQLAYRRIQERLGGRLLVDKTPSYALHPQVLARAEAEFDGALYVHLVRHPYGMIRSFEEAKLDQIFFPAEHPFTRRQLAELIWTVSEQNVLAFLEGVPEERRHTVRFEDLVRRPERTLRRLCSFLGIEYRPEMADPYRDQDGRMTDGIHRQSRMLGDVKFHQHAGVDPAVADRWRDSVSSDFLGEVTWRIADGHGYEPLERELPALEPRRWSPGRPLPVSFAQERLWFLDQLDPGTATYNVPAAVRLKGDLDLAAFRRALSGVAQRQASLRTTVVSEDGAPAQVVAPPSPPPLPVADLSALPEHRRRDEARRLAEVEAVLPFDLATGPLFRARLVRLSHHEHAVLLTMHHIVSDGWSMGVLVSEIVGHYAAAAQDAARPGGRRPELPELPVQYADFALWQRETVSEQALEKQLAYWRHRLAGVPVLELPADRPRPTVQTFRGSTLPFQLPRPLVDGLRELAREADATRYATMLAAYQALLSRWSGQDDLAVGSPFANRNHAEIENLIGFFVNTLVLRVGLGDDPTFRGLVERVREVSREAFAHQDVPFERVVQELQPARSLSVPPLFQAMLTLQDRPALGSAELPGLRLEPLEAEITVSKFDLTITLVGSGSALGGQWVWNTDLFDRSTVERIRRSFEVLLEGVVEDPDRPVSELPLLSASERREVLEEWNRPDRRYDVEGTTPEQVHRRAAEAPDAVAVVAAGRGEGLGAGHRITYGELVRRAGRVARRLRALGAGPETVVAVCAERSPALVAGLLGVLESGAAYLPLDPALPADRLAFMLADAGAPLLLADRHLLDGSAGRAVAAAEKDGGRAPRVVDLARALLPEAAEEAEGVPPAPAPESTAYLIYTSGSTGRPKGVAVSHASLANRLAWVRAADMGPDDAFLQKTTISFDVSVAEIFGPLVSGARTVLARPGEEKDTDALVRLIGRERITDTSFPPTVLYALLEERGFRGLESLETVITGGETVPPELPPRFYDRLGADLLNRYGPTETTISVTSWRCADREETVLPIGRPTAGAQVYVLDRRMRPVPAGVVGEIVLGGPGVARGYLGRPARTAEAFVPHPFAGGDDAGARLYRTGDLGRFRPDGALLFAGRVDQQIKIRGFRVELGEIESVLARHPAVREVAVTDRGDGAAKTLAAYPVPEQGEELDVAELAAWAGEHLPAYMVPSAFVVMDELPLAPTGKVDRRALPAPAEPGAAAGSGEPPRGPVEEGLAEIWSEVLGVEGIGRDDGFFDLGGHSLLATRVVSRVRQTFGVPVPLRALFEEPTVARLGRVLEAELSAARRPEALPGPPPLRPADRDRELPLSFAQERLWFLDQLEGEAPVYNVPLAARLRGPLDAGRLRRALGVVVERHEALRTTFRNAGGRPEQVIHPAMPPEWTDLDLAALPEERRAAAVRGHARAFARRPFHLGDGPLLRVALLRTGPEEHVVLLTLHHIVSDVWSMGVLLGELGAAYRALAAGERPELPELTVQYADYAAWQREWLAGPVLDAEVAFWRDALDGAPTVLELPTDHPRPAAQTFRGGRCSALLEAETAQGLERLGRERGATLFMSALAAVGAWLTRITGQDDLLVGTPVANRDRLETENLIGFFLNTLVLRSDAGGDPGFGELLERSRSTVLAAFAHQEVPFEKLVEELGAARDMSHSPLFQVMLVVQAGERASLDLPQVSVERLDTDAGAAKFDLTLSFLESDAGLLLSLEHNRDLFDPATAERFLGNLRTLLAGAVADPATPISALPLLTAAERRQIAAWNDRRSDRPRGVGVHRLVEEQAARTPDAVAVEWGAERLSYRGLDRRSNRLARLLRRRGVGTDVPVALYMERSPELVVGVLAVLKAGGAYLLLEPSYPPERLAFMVADSGAPVVLTTGGMLGSLPESEAVPILLDDEARALAAESPEPLPDGSTPDSLVYLVYTSGSTGRPKGVALPHRALENLLCWNLAEMDGGARTLQLASLSFDVAFLELFVTWSSGGALVLLSEDQRRDVPALARLLVERRVEKTVFPVLVLQQLAEEYRRLGIVPRALAEVTSTGEQLQVTPPVVELFETLETSRLHNHYGPSESHVVTALALDPEPGAWETHPPIGVPVDNTEIHLLDRALRPVPVGVPGELYIAGVSLARGYVGRPALTAERFLPDPLPLAGEADPAIPSGGRVYRTGDLARYRPDGVIEYLGRIDHQVKIRGFRVEPGEVESVLAAHPGVRETVVVPRPDGAGGHRLVAYCVAEEGRSTPEPAELRAHLARTLPEHMVPAAFVSLDAIPLNPNGKIDRKALPEPDADRAGAGAEYVEPRTPEEELLTGLWEDLLGLERVGVRDDFFALGGHSLLATQLLSRLRETFGVEPALRRVFENPTVEALAAVVEAERRSAGAVAQAPPIERTRPEGAAGTAPVSFAQERLWFLDRLEPGSSTYNMPTTVRLEGSLALGLFAASLDRIAARHASLRTTFALADERPVQVIAPPEEARVPVRLIDLSALPADRRREQAAELATREARRPFDLERGPLVRVTLLRLRPLEHVAVIAMHHVVTDGWSMGIFVAELAELYGAGAAGREPSLPELPVQYADYAAWQRRWLSGEVLEAEVEHWRAALAGAPTVLTLPTDRPRPPVQRYRGRHLVQVLPAELTAELRTLARGHGATLFMVLLAAFDAFVRRHTGQQDVVVGSPVAGRTRREVEGLIGFFLNSVVLRTEVRGASPFRDLLAAARDTALEAFAHQELPFEKLVEELSVPRTLSHAPLFQLMLVFQSRQRAVAAQELPGLELTPVRLEGSTAKFDLTLNVSEADGGLVCRWMYNSDLFDATTVERWTRRFEGMLRAAAADPGLVVAELPLMLPAERQQLLEWNDTDTRYPEAGATLHELIRRRAERTPDAVALEEPLDGRTATLTYRGLAARAGRLAAWLTDAGVAPGDLVGLCAERSLEMVVGLLGILEAGAAYVPLDPGYPEDRLAAMVADAEVAALLAQEAVLGRLAGTGGDVPILTLDGAAGPAPGVSPRPAGAVPGDPDAPAYAIFTSGSTGRPKGVVNAHRGVVNRLAWMQQTYRLGTGDRVLQKTPYSFDVSVWEFFWPLIEGAALVVARPGGHQDSAYLVQTIGRTRVTTIHFVPSMLQVFVDDPGASGCPSLRRIIASGEALPPDLAERTVRTVGAPLHNLYGPTEAAIDVTWWPCDPGSDRATVPIGRPVANTAIHLLDPHLRPVPPGVAGELVIAGAQVARGYLRRPALTAERFVPDPFSADPGSRMYRTGDLARHRPDGAVEFLGRLDHQVKLRGFRIELGEIETVLTGHPSVRETVVMLRDDLPGGRGLAAYLVPAASDADPAALEHDLRRVLGRELPEYMVPAAFVVLDELPLNPNGKVDRKALPAPEGGARGAGSEPPRDALERELAELFEHALGDRVTVGRHDDFFDLGGNSIAGAVLINRLQERLGRIVHVVALFDAPTVAGLAEYLAREVPDAVAAAWGEGALSGRAGVEGGRRRRVDEARLDDLRALVRRRGRGGVPEAPNRSAVFVLSPPRSGSTLLRVMLGGHPEVFAPPELELLGFATLAERREAFGGRDAFRLEGAVRAVMELRRCGPREAELMIEEWEEEGLTTAGCYARLQELLGERTLVDKTPTYAWDPDTLWAAEECFDQPRYIHLVRHPYGMIHSFEEARIDEIFFGREHPFERRELAELAWLLAHRNIERFLAGVPEERRMLLRFEDLVAEPRAELERLCAFLGIELHPAMATPYEPAPEAGSRMTDGIHAESRMLGDVKFHQHSGVDPATADRWRQAIDEDFLGEPTWALAAALGYDAADRPGAPEPPLEAAGRAPGDPAPLSFAQERLWFLDRMEPASAAYNIPAVFRLTGRLDAGALEAALAAVVERHETLRSRFERRDGRPVQVAQAPGGFRMHRLDLEGTPETDRRRELERVVGATSNRPFDLAQGGLFRALLVRLGPQEHVLLLVMHHIVSDGWSVGVLFRELTTLYRRRTSGGAAEPSELPDLPIQYADFAAWQRARLSGRRLERELDFWRRELDGVRPLELPTDRPRPAVQTYRGAARPVALAPELAERLRLVARESGATPFMILAALFGALLSRMAGQLDLTLGTPVANRTRSETEPLIGFFANTLVLRLDLEGEPGLRELLARVRSRSLDLFAHQDVPFEKVVEELRPVRDLARSPLFQVMFALQNARGETATLPELAVEPVRPGITATKFELTLSVAEGPRGVVGGLEYNRDLFDPTTVDRMIGHLRTLATAAVEQPERPLAALPWMPAEERHQLLVEWNATRRPQAGALSERILARAEAIPEAPAVTFGGRTLSYGELVERCGRLARHLLALGVEPEERVALCLERSEEMVVAALAVLMAGGAYVPLDPTHPQERLAYVLEDSGARVLLAERRTEGELEAALPADGRVLLVDADAAAIARRPARPLPPAPRPDALAYVIYTSGSTGRPKGVEISRGALHNFLVSMAERPGLGAADTLVAVTTLSFDIAGLELFGPLLVGGRVVVASHEETVDGERLAALLEESGATVLQATPATWRMLLDAGWQGDDGLRALCGGEALPPELAGRLTPRVEGLWNMYGPTETTVWSSVLEVVPDGSAVPVGGPIDNTSFAVIDRGLRPVPVGVPGELAIGGAGLARGYHGRPALTAAAFVPDPFAPAELTGARMYRTGDLVRSRPDGRLDFLGRIDHQVKVRGHRIELGEIESALAGHEAVSRAVASVQGVGGEARLVAYLVPDLDAGKGEPLEPPALRAFLRRLLPDYMVPSAFVALDELPLTPNGKVDRKALPDLGSVRLEGSAAAVAPRTQTERRLATLWQEVLDVEGVGARDDFFALGGHSLLLVELNRRLAEAFGSEVPVVELFRHSTVEGLARYLDGRAETARLPEGVVRLREGAGDAPPLFLVHPLSGELSLYRPLVDALDGGGPVYGFQARGLAAGVPPDDRVEAMAGRYAEALAQVHPDGPVCLAGSSMGGLVAFEMARRLTDAGRAPALLALIDTPDPRHRQPAPRAEGQLELALLGYLVAGDPGIRLEELGAMEREERLAYVLRRGHEAGSLPAAYGLDELERLVSTVEANQAAMDRYRPQPWAGRLTYFRAEDGAGGPSPEGAPWDGLADGGVEVHEVPGTHISLHAAGNVEPLAGRLAESLRRAGGEPGTDEGSAEPAAVSGE